MRFILMRDKMIELVSDKMREAQGEAVGRQYYFRVSDCPAKESTDPDCICWHDSGTGPCKTAREADRESFCVCLEWRDKPAPPAAQGEAVKPGQYVIRHNDDGEFGQSTGWLYRDGGDPCVVTGKPVYVWRPLRDLIGKPPAPAVPDDVAKDAARYRWLRDESRPIDELFMATRADRAGTYRVSNEMDDIIDAAMLAAAPEVPK